MYVAKKLVFNFAVKKFQRIIRYHQNNFIIIIFYCPRIDNTRLGFYNSNAYLNKNINNMKNNDHTNDDTNDDDNHFHLNFLTSSSFNVQPHTNNFISIQSNRKQTENYSTQHLHFHNFDYLKHNFSYSHKCNDEIGRFRFIYDVCCEKN